MTGKSKTLLSTDAPAKKSRKVIDLDCKMKCRTFSKMLCVVIVRYMQKKETKTIQIKLTIFLEKKTSQSENMTIKIKTLFSNAQFSQEQLFLLYVCGIFICIYFYFNFRFLFTVR